MYRQHRHGLGESFCVRGHCVAENILLAEPDMLDECQHYSLCIVLCKGDKVPAGPHAETLQRSNVYSARFMSERQLARKDENEAHYLIGGKVDFLAGSQL